jgi:acetyl-CoA carboxylase biotin carboxylase subunit
MNTGATGERLFRRVLIANRGEVAVRVGRTCRALGIGTVMVHSAADRHLPYLAAADAAVCIGPGPARESYLNREAILQAAVQTDCQAVHPGYGFLSEDALFAYLCDQQRLTFIGPAPPAIRLMGDKAAARRSLAAAGLPAIPGSADGVPDLAAARAAAAELGYPVMLKALGGGGGRGIRPCRDADDLGRYFPQARLEAEKAFGNAGLYLEKMITSARHIEFQVLADAFGEVVCLGERECSIQRHHQKLIEESPSPALDPAARAETAARVVAALRQVGYRSAGTLEFLRDAAGRLHFMEMNTRLQVEHPVTEMIFGLDIVAEQIRIAANRPLALGVLRPAGHAIECRINAEDPAAGFRPCPGVITALEPGLDAGPGRVRFDTFAAAGVEIPPYYDSMIGKVIAWGEDREAARRTLVNALRGFRIEGVRTTLPLHLEILESRPFRDGDYDVDTLGRLMGA